MAIEGAAATVPLSPGQRLEGLNSVAELRANVFGLNIEPELERFIKDMRDLRDINHKQNERALAAIFFMAKIPAERHGVNISDLTTDEKRELVKAMNHFRAVVSLFPKRLTMPNLPTTEINGVNPPGILLPKFRRKNNAERITKNVYTRN